MYIEMAVFKCNVGLQVGKRASHLSPRHASSNSSRHEGWNNSELSFVGGKHLEKIDHGL